LPQKLLQLFKYVCSIIWFNYRLFLGRVFLEFGGSGTASLWMGHSLPSYIRTILFTIKIQVLPGCKEHHGILKTNNDNINLLYVKFMF
jgi:hypothetical protein